MNTIFKTTVLCLALTGCGGGSNNTGSSTSSANVVVSASPAGIYSGTLKPNTTTSYDLLGVISPSNRTFIYTYNSVGSVAIYTGSNVSKANATVTATLTPYVITKGNTYTVSGSNGSNTTAFSGQQPTNQGTITGTASDSSGSAPVVLNFATSDSIRGASLTALAGTYKGTFTKPGAAGTDSTTVTFDTSGNMTGTDSSGCTYTGNATVSDVTINVYDVSSVAVTCSSPSTPGVPITGANGNLVVNADNSIFMVYSNATTATLLNLKRN